jgi:transposase
LRHESDVADEEWAEIAPLIPPAKPGGNKRTVNLREVINVLMYILRTGCQLIPKDWAARSTIYGCFDRGSWDGTLERIHHTLYVGRRQAGRTRSQANRGNHRRPERQKCGKGGAHVDPHGYDACKKVKGKNGASWSIPRE